MAYAWRKVAVTHACTILARWSDVRTTNKNANNFGEQGPQGVQKAQQNREERTI
jgi:hypothetical protein